MKKILLIIFVTFIFSKAQANQLLRAVEDNSINQLGYFLDAGADPNMSGQSKVTALMRASLLGNEDMVKLLVKYNADVNKSDISGTTALHLAARQGHSNIIKILLAEEANINKRDFSNSSPLMRAVLNNHDDSAILLIAKKPNFFIKNNSGKDVLDLAREQKNYKIFDLILASFTYRDLNYLLGYKKKLNKKMDMGFVNIINARIDDLSAIKLAKEKLITVTMDDVASIHIISGMENYPCLNSEVASILVSDSTCVKNIVANLHSFEPKPKIIEGSVAKTSINKEKSRDGKKGGAILKNGNMPIDLSATPSVAALAGVEAMVEEKIVEPKFVPKSPESLGLDYVSRFQTIQDIRTNEWQINPDFVPVSVIDEEVMARDNLFNRKFVYQDSQRSLVETRKIAKMPRIKNPVLVADEKTLDKMGGSNYYIQLGAFKNYNNAKNLSQKAMKFGEVFLSEDKNKKILTVFIGPLDKISKANDLRSSERFREVFGEKTLIRSF